MPYPERTIEGLKESWFALEPDPVFLPPPPEITIEELELTCRAYNALANLGVHTLSQLSNLPRPQLRQVSGVGKKTITEIDAVLRHHTGAGLKDR